MKPLRFSQRIGKVSVRQVLQIEDIDEVLNNRLWNHILNDFIHEIPDYSSRGESDRGLLYKAIWINFFHQRLDEIPLYSNGKVNTAYLETYLSRWFFNAEWYEKYDLIEFFIQLNETYHFTFVVKIENALREELAGYTIIENQIVPITSEQEVSAIEDALSNTSKHQSVETHLQRALELLSDRQNPDYRNSIKESISAVESYCRLLTDNPNAILGDALKQLEKSNKIPSAIKSAFSTLYGYASDSSGIRHSLKKDDTEAHFEDAKFMLVSCSAFINYLKAKEV